MFDEKIIQFWGVASLVRWPAEVLSETRLSDDAKKFLTEIGLPRGDEFSPRFDLTLREMRRLAGDARRLFIGYVVGLPIQLDLNQAGRVVCIEDGGLERFINSDVSRFGECMMFYENYRRRVRKMEEGSAIQELVSETEHAMRKSDPAAFANPETWWAVTIEQMNAGLL